jgi:hypothetical protein
MVGADLRLQRQFFLMPESVALNFALLVASLLLTSGFPDAKENAEVRKHCGVVSLGPTAASVVCLFLLAKAHL